MNLSFSSIQLESKGDFHHSQKKENSKCMFNYNFFYHRLMLNKKEIKI